MCLFQRLNLEGLSRTCAGLKGEHELQINLIITDSVTVLNQSLTGENSVKKHAYCKHLLIS